MLNKILLGVAIVVVIFGAYVGYILAKNKIQSPPDTVEINANGTLVSVEYSRPFKKDRKILGGLVGYGKYWRTGANEATQISFSKDVIFAGQPVHSGSYWLYTIPNEQSWTIALNRELGAWGIPGPDPNLDILRTEIQPVELDEVVEQFEISLAEESSEIHLSLKWDQTKVEIPVQSAS